MKRIKKSISALIFIICMALCCACGKTDTGSAAGNSIEGELVDIMTEIYAGVDVDAETKEAMQGYITDMLTADNEQALLGVAGISYTEGVFSVPMISSIPYQCVLLRVSTDDVESVKTALKENADLNKWVCTSAETALVENVGDVVLFIMCDTDTAYAVSESFQALGK
ncbi:MAG: hypothetical protein NC314_07340 [Roseburia sp.]|nr:hypothetical protein [Ruminococcus sp.]MCM1155185.1 hypothetical protein [Roseburia sp.]MCM1242641.1 hypothetical protein [Roseburia sp.]